MSAYYGMPQHEIMSGAHDGDLSPPEKIGVRCENGSNLATSKSLRNIDYMEYVERSGKATLEFMLSNSQEMNTLTDNLRSTLAFKDEQFGM